MSQIRFPDNLKANEEGNKFHLEGKTLGGPKGSTIAHTDFLANHRDVVKQLRAGQSVRNMAKITGKGVSTVQRVKGAMVSTTG